MRKFPSYMKQKIYFNLLSRNIEFAVRLRLIDPASIWHNFLYGPMSLFPNSEQIP